MIILPCFIYSGLLPHRGRGKSFCLPQQLLKVVVSTSSFATGIFEMRRPTLDIDLNSMKRNLIPGVVGEEGKKHTSDF